MQDHCCSEGNDGCCRVYRTVSDRTAALMEMTWLRLLVNEWLSVRVLPLASSTQWNFCRPTSRTSLLMRSVSALALLDPQFNIQLTTRCSESANLCQGKNLPQRWSGIWIQIFGLVQIRIQMSAWLLIAFITWSASVISLIVVKVTVDCMRNADKSPKIPYSTVVREVDKWSGITTES